MEQVILRADAEYAVLDGYLQEAGVKKIFLVCDSSLPFLKGLSRYFETLTERTGIGLVSFNDFQPNPLYESVVEGVKLLHESKCDQVIAVGGGSAMDVAKCIKLYSNMDPAVNYLQQEIVRNDLPLLAIPTTAGTGSEATRYAVIYYEGAKQSVTHESCIPSVVLMDPSALETLPVYQKKSTMLDALMHATESFWSVNSTEESKGYSREAIRLVLENMDGYLANDTAALENMLKAANTAGRAINITQTTAGHAMCYKITSLFGAAHGHAAALVVRKLWPWMLAHPEKVTDPRGAEYLQDTFAELAAAYGCGAPEEAAKKLQRIFSALELPVPAATEEQIRILSSSVNPVRLKNNPVQPDAADVGALYREILSQE